jgi:hypothetical protein
VKGEVQASPTPIISVAVSADGTFVAAAGIRGSVAVIERTERKLARTLVGPGLPVWSVAFLPDNRTMLTGGTDRMVRRWDAITGDHVGAVALAQAEDPLAAYAGDPGAEVFRACVACHTLSADEGNRAGRRGEQAAHDLLGRVELQELLLERLREAAAAQVPAVELLQEPTCAPLTELAHGLADEQDELGRDLFAGGLAVGAVHDLP